MLGDTIKGDLVRHETFGIGRVEETSGFGEGQKVFVYFPGSEKTAWFGKAAVTHLEASEKAAYELVKLAIKELRQEDTPALELGSRWEGGEMILKPGEEGLTPHSIPIETFFHKIVMVRDRLRVMEQQINANQRLTDEEKVNLQQYITRIYGSLTTFNILFKNKADHFVGQKGEK
jgi:hypothetical protein